MAMALNRSIYDFANLNRATCEVCSLYHSAVVNWLWNSESKPGQWLFAHVFEMILYVGLMKVLQFCKDVTCASQALLLRLV